MTTSAHTISTCSRFENVEPSIMRLLELSRLEWHYTKIILHFILDFFDYNTIIKTYQGISMSYIPLIARVDSLPPLPESILKIEALFTHKDPDIEDIVKIIESDPSLTADILAKVNAPIYGFSRSIISILQAVTLFGSAQIRSIVLASSLNRSFDIDMSPYNITTYEFSKISIMQSNLIFQWYMAIDIDTARNLTPIAFLMETGKILIAKEILENEKYEDFLADLQKYDDISYVENKHTMMTSAQISALVFKQLNLNDTFSESMSYLDNEHKIPDHIVDMVTALRVVRTVINLKEHLTDSSIERGINIIEENSLDVEAFKRAIKRIKTKYL